MISINGSTIVQVNFSCTRSTFASECCSEFDAGAGIETLLSFVICTPEAHKHTTLNYMFESHVRYWKLDDFSCRNGF